MYNCKTEIEEVQIRVSGKKVFRFRRGAERKKNAAFEKLTKTEVQIFLLIDYKKTMGISNDWFYHSRSFRAFYELIVFESVGQS